MAYGEAKVYFDGSHYIAIPKTERPQKPRAVRREKEIVVNDNNEVHFSKTNEILKSSGQKPIDWQIENITRTFL